MFKVYLPITKSKKSPDGKKLSIEGVASGPAIDKDFERFDSQALEKMMNMVNEGDIPIRLEHENKIYTEVGTWKKAMLDEHNTMMVEGEIDTELSLGKDIEVLLKRGTPMGLSVAGMVNEAVYEYSQEMDKNILVYKDISLAEISIVKNPAYHDAELSMAKSVGAKKAVAVEKSTAVELKETTEAQRLTEIYKSMSKVSPEQYIEEVNKSEKPIFKSWEDLFDNGIFKQLHTNISGEIQKCIDCEMDMPMSNSLSADDMQSVIQISKFLSEVEIPESMTMPKVLETQDYYDKIGDEAYVIMPNRSRVLPHHNPDYTVNKELVAWALKRLFDGSGYWTPKEYTIAINHLYYHVKELGMTKPKSQVEQKSDIEKKETSPKFSESEMELFEKSFLFVNGFEKSRPTHNGQAINDEQISKMAKAYSILNQDINKSFMNKKDEIKKNTEEEVQVETPVVETPATEAPVVEPEAPVEQPQVETPVVEAPAEAAPEVETPAEPTPEAEKVEEATPEAQPAEVAGEEQGEPVVETPVEAPAEEPAPVETPAPEEAPVVEAPAPEVTPEAPAGGEPTVAEEVTKSVNTMAKSVSDLQAVVKGLSNKVEKVDAVEKSVSEISDVLNQVVKSIDTLAKHVSTRKSVASYQALEKSMQTANEANSMDSLVEKFMGDGLTFKEAYAKAKAEITNV